MHWYNKIAWSEGLFLRPQLFQQQERYFEHFVHQRAAMAGPFFWGFARYHIDLHGLSLGKVGLTRAAGLFPDGTPFDAPDEALLPAPFTAGQEYAGQVICLAVQTRQADSEETTFEPPDSQKASLSRFGVFDAEVRDSNSIGQGPKPVQLSRLRLRVLPAAQAEGSWLALPFARIDSVGADGGITLDPDFAPPVCGIGSSPPLTAWLTELHDICRLRANTLATRLSASDGQAQESAEVADFLLLQILNRADASLTHLLAVPQTSPEQLYLLLRGLSGELSTFVRPDTRRPPAYDAYVHGELNRSFVPLVASVRGMLNQVLVRSARLLAMDELPNGVRLANVGPAELRGYSSLVFAVAAQMPADRLAADFPQHCKVSPHDRLSELIRTHVPGIALQLLPVPPRQIPFNAGFVYFEVEPHGALWEHLLVSGGVALHIGTSFPGLRLQLWGISRK